MDDMTEFSSGRKRYASEADRTQGVVAGMARPLPGSTPEYVAMMRAWAPFADAWRRWAEAEQPNDEDLSDEMFGRWNAMRQLAALGRGEGAGDGR